MKKINVLSTSCMLILTGAVFLTGCASTIKYGKEFDTANVKNIKKGITTKGDTLQLFGQPESKTISSGKETWMYFYKSHSVKSAGVSYIPIVGAFAGSHDSKGENSSLTLVFDKAVVRECSFSYGSSASRSYNFKIRGDRESTAPTTQVTEPCGD